MSSSEDVNPSVALTKANNHLAISLHQLLAREKGNVFFSPFSISTAMAMLLCAAEDETETELRVALGHTHAGLQKKDVATVFELYLSTLFENSDSYTLACGNAMLSQKDFQIKEQYKSILSNAFKAMLMEVDFQIETKKVANRINEWVSEKTNKMIPKLVDSLDPATVIVLLTAVYFKGSWLHKFDERATYKQPFYNKGLKKNVKDVDMMHMSDKMFPFTENESIQVLELPYIGEEIAMLIFLPRERNGLTAMESYLTSSFIQDLKQNIRKQKIELTLPKFRLEYTKSLVSVFKNLGARRIFARGAELGIASDSPDLSVSDIFHKAVLVVNEEGSEAAAVTMVRGGRQCLIEFHVPVCIVDHPFAFVIYDTRNDLILFMGRVEEL